MESSSKSKILKIITNDNITTEVDFEIISQSTTIKNMAEICDDSDELIFLPNLDSFTLKKVIEWCEKLIAVNFQCEDIDNKWLETFFEKNSLESLVISADYLEIETLLEESTSYVANLINNMSNEEFALEFIDAIKI